MTKRTTAVPRRVLLIGLDAAEPRLIERWTEDGSLPRLRELRRDGAYGRLDPPDGCLIGLPWPSFFTGCSVAEHGLYKYMIWVPDRMREVRPRPRILPLEPFWRTFGPQDPRPVVMDVPLVYAPAPFAGAEVAGWATHERLNEPGTYPPELARRLTARFGAPPFPDEVHRRRPLGRLLGERDTLISATDRAADLAVHLLESEHWDLGIVCFTATHRAGHKLWSETGSTGEGTAAERAAFADALYEVYASVDRAVGRLVDRAGPDTAVVVFSLHGMGPNTSLVDLLPEMLERVLTPSDDSVADTSTSLLDTLRSGVPLAWREGVKRRLPMSVQDRLSGFWRTGRVDWARTRAFCLAADLHGYIRVNLRGRESRGVVSPGEEYDTLCGNIADGLASFVDADTGDRVIKHVVRRDTVYPTGPRADALPDLTVVWGDRPVAELTEVRSNRYGSIHWPAPGWNPDGRSGNHRTQGFALVRAPGFETPQLTDGTILDLAPTVYRLLGRDPPPHMAGQPLRSRGEALGGTG